MLSVCLSLRSQCTTILFWDNTLATQRSTGPFRYFLRCVPSWVSCRNLVCCSLCWADLYICACPPCQKSWTLCLRRGWSTLLPKFKGSQMWMVFRQWTLHSLPSLGMLPRSNLMYWAPLLPTQRSRVNRSVNFCLPTKHFANIVVRRTMQSTDCYIVRTSSLEHALQWPTLLVTRGLARKPASLQAWDDLNFSRSWPMMPECLDHGMHLFTDGSTDGSRSVPRSAWSVVLLEPGSFDYALVQSGPLPGKQCNYRAEMFATLAALCSSVSATVYIDNKRVVQGLHRLQRDGWDQFYWNKSPEIQLWREIWEVLRTKQPQAWVFVYVRSHRDFKQQPTDFQAWTAFGNETADRYAKTANQAREHSEVKLYQAASRDWNFQLDRMNKVATLLQGVFLGGRSGLPAKEPSQISRTDTPVSITLGSPADHLLSLSPDDYHDALLGPRFLWVIHKWWADQQWKHAPSGMSIAELYFFFSESTGWMAPQNLAKWEPNSLPFKWRTTVQTAFVTENDYEALQFNDVFFSKQCTIFLHALKFFAARHALDLGFPRGQALSFLDCFEPVQQISYAPDCIAEVRARFKDRIESSWKSFKHAVFRTSREPMLCPLEVQHPLTTWKLYYSRRRRKAIA